MYTWFYNHNKADFSSNCFLILFKLWLIFVLIKNIKYIIVSTVSIGPIPTDQIGQTTSTINESVNTFLLSPYRSNEQIEKINMNYSKTIDLWMFNSQNTRRWVAVSRNNVILVSCLHSTSVRSVRSDESNTLFKSFINNRKEKINMHCLCFQCVSCCSNTEDLNWNVRSIQHRSKLWHIRSI